MKARDLFLDRMKREGRYEEFINTRNMRQKESGCSLSAAHWAAAREMGYVDVKTELALHDQYLAGVYENEEDKLSQEMRDKKAKEKELAALDALLDGLPPNASPAVEMDWIRAHPAMRRGAISKDPIIITSSDLNPKHGKCPSQSAANALSYWANNADKFYTALITEHKKRSESSNDPSEEEDSMDLESAVERLKDLLKGDQ